MEKSQYFFEGVEGNKNSFSLIEVKGEEAQRFLQAQTTSDVKALVNGQGQPSALLDRKAKIQAYFYLFCAGEDFQTYFIVCDKRQRAAIAEHLDKFIFADKVEILDRSGDFVANSLISGSTIAVDLLKQAGSSAQYFALEDKLYFRLPVSPCASFAVFSHTENGVIAASAVEQEIELRRIEAGVPQFLTDYNDALMVELGLSDAAVSYTKGCFQGQEVLARVKAQGSPSRQVMGITIENLSTPLTGTFPQPFYLDKDTAGGEPFELGTIASHGFSKRLNKHIALVFLKRDYRVPGKVVDCYVGKSEKKRFKSLITLLPFIDAQEDEDLARTLYDEALKDFTDEKGSLAVSKLKDAIALSPKFEDAYETLGVILSKIDDGAHLDEAIEYMQKLATMNEDSVMAHTNLSVFYLDKGDKEKAEEEKAISMSIRMRIAARMAMQEKKEKEDKAALIKESEERMQMFLQVLEIDEEDLFANHGLGSCCNNLEKFDEAIKYLNKAIAIKASHTQCYEELGKAYEGLKDLDKARAAYERGIEVAAKKGDMQPLKLMQGRLAALQK